MRSMSFMRAGLALLAMLLLSAVATFGDTNGRDFAGFYSVHHTRVQGDHVRVTLNLQVHNNGTTDVRHAVIVLRQNTGLELVGKTEPIVLLRSHDHVNLRQQFTVSRREFEQWHTGGQPGLAIIYRARGKSWEKTITVTPKNGI